MAKCSVRTDVDGLIVGKRRGKVVPPGSTEVTPEVWATMGDLTHPAGGGLRYKLVNGSAVEQTDNRPLVRLTSPSIVDAGAQLTISRQVGSGAVTIAVSVLDAGGFVNTAINRTILAEIGGRTVELEFTGGVATITVPTDHPRGVAIWNTRQIRVEKPLFIEVTRATQLTSREV